MNKNGCGLGLTVSKNIARALGGDITVSSVKGKGSTFVLSIKEMEKDSINISLASTLRSINDIKVQTPEIDSEEMVFKETVLPRREEVK